MDYNIPQMLSLCIDTGVETSSEVPHHSHGHSWYYLLHFFPNRRLQLNQITVSTFTVLRTVFGRPGVFSFIVDPVALTESTHNKIVFQLGATSELEMSAEGPLNGDYSVLS